MMSTVTDDVTEFSGVVTGRAEYSTGCRQYLVQPSIDDAGKWQESHWFDEDRLLTKAEIVADNMSRRSPAPWDDLT